MAGDDDAYASLYEEYVQDLYQYGLCFTSDTELVKDCIQDLFVYLYANRSHLEISCQVKTYLLVSLKHNICRSLLRSQKYDSIEEEIPFLAEMSVEDQFIEDESLHNETKDAFSSDASSERNYVLPFCPGVTYGRYMPTDGFELSVGPKLDSAFPEKNTRSVRRFVLISVFCLSGKIFY